MASVTLSPPTMLSANPLAAELALNDTGKSPKGSESKDSETHPTLRRSKSSNKTEGLHAQLIVPEPAAKLKDGSPLSADDTACGFKRDDPVPSVRSGRSREAEDESPTGAERTMSHFEVEDIPAEARAGVTLSPSKQFMIGMGAMLCYFVGSASTTAVILVIPSISRDFGISNLQAQWIASSYGLAYGCTLLVTGRFADIFGRRLLFVGGMTFYTICSLISPLIPDWIALCVVRAFAGLGLAVASPAAFGIVATSFPEGSRRTLAFSMLALGNPFGAMAGTIIGGAIAIANKHSWSYLYLLLAGISLVPIAIGTLVVPEKWFKSGPKARIDWIGATLVTGSTSLFAFSLTQSGVVEGGWRTAYIPSVLALSVALGVAFVAFEYHLEHHPTSPLSRGIPPILKTSLLTRQRGKIAAITFGSFAVFTCVPGWIYLTTVFYQDYKGYSPLGNAVHTLPSCVSGMFAAALTIYLLPRAKPAYIISCGAFLSGLACLLFAVEPTGTNYWACEMISCLLISFGADMGVGVGSVLIADLVKEEEQSIAGAVYQTSIQIAAAFGVCLSSLVASAPSEEPSAILKALRDAFGMNTAWAWIVPIVMMIVPLGWDQKRTVGRA